jgi:lipopolysaccharide/colanic/teichoic acid biosynthesis glycosyltransferase
MYTCGALLVGSAAASLLQALTGLNWVAGLLLVAALLAFPVAIDRVTAVLRRGQRQRTLTRIALIGGAAVAKRMRSDLDRGSHSHAFVGRIAMPGDTGGSLPPLAELDGIREALVEHKIQLLILSPTASRELVFDELVSRCLDLPVQLVELSYFYETVFGYVPISEMNAVWFQYLLDPSSRFPHPLAKRAIDLLGAVLLALPAFPLCGLLVLLVRRDGGRGIFRQARIGEGGRPFTLYKLRTMHPSSGKVAQWAAIDDPRVTRIGRFLRVTHFDELPQLLNVLRGEMSLVGPRPEQPAVVERLEREVPFYQRRHLMRPGISGWAQIRCGYARSDSGSVWKHCHDLYYLKHRSIRLDLRILLRTAVLVLLGAIRRTEAVELPPEPLETVTPHMAAVPDPAPLVVSGNRPG